MIPLILLGVDSQEEQRPAEQLASGSLSIQRWWCVCEIRVRGVYKGSEKKERVRSFAEGSF